MELICLSAYVFYLQVFETCRYFVKMFDSETNTLYGDVISLVVCCLKVDAGLEYPMYIAPLRQYKMGK